VLVFAVLLLAAGVFVLAGIAQLAATQALVGQNEWEGLNRRIKLENSRAMGRQFMLTRMFNGVVSTNTGYTNATLGGFSLSPVSETSAGSDYWTTLSTTNTNVNLKINPFTLMERGGFYRVVVPGTIYDGVENVPWNFQVRTRSPIAAGYPLTQHRPASNAISGFLNPPYIDMNDPEQFVGFHEMARMRVSSVTNTNVDPTGYEGYLGVPIGVAAWGPFTNSSFMPANPSITALHLVIDLGANDPQDLSQVLLFRVDETMDRADFTTNGTNYVGLPVTGLRLIGTEVYGLKPLQVVIPASRTNLTNLLLQGRNPLVTGREVYVNYQRTAGAGGNLGVIATNATGNWRVGISVANSAVSFSTAGIDIVGGIRTDGAITGSPVLEQELDPGGLDYVADRMMWLEDYKTP
jgi:hypothetical protein